jgi:hypothetical protein
LVRVTSTLIISGDDMKLRYLFSLIYLILLLLSFIVPRLGDYLFILIAPVAIPIGYLSDAIGGPRDTAVPAMIAGLGQFYLLGLILYKMVRSLKNQPTEFDGPSKIAEKKASRDARP